jgi:hypothetical protein
MPYPDGKTELFTPPFKPLEHVPVQRSEWGNIKDLETSAGQG